MSAHPTTLSEYIREIRAGLVCERCGRYIGSLADDKYLPPPYPIALDKITAEQEAEAIVGFEWHMLGLLRQHKFTLRHPQSNGRCVSVREWYEERAADDADDDDEQDT